MKPRVLIVGRTRYRLPLEPNLRRKFDALRVELDVRVLASGSGSDATFHLVPPFRPRALDGALFYLALPFRAARELRAFDPDAVVTQSPYEAAAVLVARLLTGARAKIVLEVHGDWRTATRLYGSSAREALAPLADRVALAAVQRVDAVRTISSYTTGLVRAAGVEPAAEFPAFMDLEPFLGAVAPLPVSPSPLFVGVLERYKDVDGLATAWRLAAPRLPGTALRIVGRGSRAFVVEGLARDLPGRTDWAPTVPNDRIADELDRATCLVLPSRSEGLGRIVVEALCRGRPVVATRVGGITDLVADGENGLLVPTQDPAALADALVRILSDRGLAARLGSGARTSVEPWLASPEEYARRTRLLVEAVTA